MSSSPAASPQARLQQLEAYLRQDPNNALLLRTAFEAACQADALESARFHHTHLSSLGAPLPDTLQTAWLRLLHRAGEITPALAYASAAEAARTLSPEAAGIASLVALDAEDLGSAARWSQAALALAEPPPEAWVTQASLALGRQSVDEARAALAHALAQRPNDARCLSTLGFTALMAGAWLDAIANFQRALQGMPRHIGTWLGLGWAHLLNDDGASARPAFEQAIALDPNFAESHAGLAALEISQNNPQAALPALRRARKLDSEAPGVIYAQALHSGSPQGLAALRRLAQRLRVFGRKPQDQ
jgi:tetratricopeptide (TPR) repeat protein